MPLKLHLIKYQHRHENPLQQICREIVQRVGKWIFRKMAKSTLAFYTRCRMDSLKSRKKPCSFQLSHCNQRLATSDLQLATCNLRTADWNLLPNWKTMKGKEKRETAGSRRTWNERSNMHACVFLTCGKKALKSIFLCAPRAKSRPFEGGGGALFS